MLGPLSYIGGKRALAKRIIDRLPKHTTYVEAFAGGAQVFFHKPPSAVEVLNDVDHELVNFFRVCQNHHQEFLRYLRFAIVSRGIFNLLRQTNPDSLTDIQRAARYFYLLRNAFASLVRSPTYHWHVVHPPGFNPEKLSEIIDNSHKRLARVQIEELPFEKIIQNFDRPSTFFFLDPPYYGKNLYRYNLEPSDFERLAAVLRDVKGKFLLTLNDVPEVRQLFREFRIESVELAYTAQKHAGRRYHEVFITNYSPSQSKGGPNERSE